MTFPLYQYRSVKPPGASSSEAAVAGRARQFADALHKYGLSFVFTADASLAFYAADGFPAAQLGRPCRCDELAPEAARRHLRREVGEPGARLGTLALCCPGGGEQAETALDRLVQLVLDEMSAAENESALLEELSVSWECLQAVYDLNGDFSSASDKRGLLAKIAARATALGENMQAVLWLEDDGRLEPVAVVGGARVAPRGFEESFVGQSFAKGNWVVCNDLSRAPLIDERDPELAAARRLAIVPLRTRVRNYGLLVVWQETDAVAFDSRSMRLLDTLALQAAMVVENDALHREAIHSEKLKHEIEIGSKIQQTLLTGVPPGGLPGITIAASSISSQKIDGDFYDFIEHGEDCFDLIVGDVMGKGIPAALVGAATKNCFLRAVSQLQSGERHPRPSAEKIVTWVNNEVTAKLMQFESFVTACYARFDLPRREVTFVDCGHTKTIHYRRRSGTTVALEGDNMPLGFSEREIFTETIAPVEDGDVLFFFSDGVTETRCPSGEFFGDERLAEFVRANARLEPKVMIARLHDMLRDFSQRDHFHDDLTCVVVRLETKPLEHNSQPLRLTLTSELTSLARARRFVREAAARLPAAPWPDESVDQLELAVNEVVTNVVEHAYGNKKGNQIEISAEKYGDGLRLLIHHWGESFDPSHVPAPAFDGSRDGGFGLFIIASCVDSVIYSRDADGRHTIQLIKNAT